GRVEYGEENDSCGGRRSAVAGAAERDCRKRWISGVHRVRGFGGARRVSPRARGDRPRVVEHGAAEVRRLDGLSHAQGHQPAREGDPHERLPRSASQARHGAGGAKDFIPKPYVAETVLKSVEAALG